jgi:hypothetical protein
VAVRERGAAGAPTAAADAVDETERPAADAADGAEAERRPAPGSATEQQARSAESARGATRRPWWRRPETMAVLGTMIGIVAMAAILRFIELSTNPGGVYGDEASEGLDALRLLHQPGYHPDWLVWFVNDGGREALFAYVVAAGFAVFGDSALILREIAAAFGVAGVVAIVALARRWGNGPAIVAGAWAAGSLWLICVSRDGMRNTIVPFFGAVALIALLHWAAHPGRRAAILAGAVVSLSALYTYQPLKLLPLLVVVWLVWLRRANRPAYERLRTGIVPAVAAFIVVGAPMIAVAITEPISYFGRATAVSVFNPDVITDVPYPIHIIRTLLMFGIFGDGNGRHDVASLPLLPIPLVLVGLLGLRRLWISRRDPADALILISLPVMMIPPLLFPDGYSPHFLRALGLAAPLGVTIGLGAAELVRIVRSRWGGRAALAASGLVAATLVGVAAWSGYVYLDRSLADRWDSFSFAANTLAQKAAEQPNSAVVLEGFDVVDVEYLDYHAMPAIIAPGIPIADPKIYSRIFAPTQQDLIRTVGHALGERAQPIAFDPWGKPVVWAVTP